MTTARFGLRRKICQQFTPSRASCTWNILLPLQKSPDRARMLPNQLTSLPRFSLYLPLTPIHLQQAHFKTILIHLEEKNENSRFTACSGHGNGTHRLPEYGLKRTAFFGR
ncbi:hypothetical protein AHX85_000723 [Salmonella enterica subsp. enterica]|nr:hypothetical protein [Salmonella enterica subsp. enterica]